MPLRSRTLFEPWPVADSAPSPGAARLLSAPQGWHSDRFTQVNYSAYIPSSQYFGGKPQRFREVQADFHGHVAELLAKNTQQGQLDQSVSKEDTEMLLEALKQWERAGRVLSLQSKASLAASVAATITLRGWFCPGTPVPSKPMQLDQLLKADLWQNPDERTGIRLAVLHFSTCGRHGHDRQGVQKGV